MAANQKHRTTGNSNCFCEKVEFLIEIQLDNESAFLNEFSSQPEPGKSGSNSGSDTSNTETSIDLGINT